MRNRYEYRRNLPHYQKNDRAHFVTFVTKDRWILPSRARDTILEACLHIDGVKAIIHAAVVMPEHVHLILTPLRNDAGDEYSLPQILHSIKSYSAHEINRYLKRKGTVWLDESFDHVLRSEDRLDSKIQYLCQNPVRRGLVKEPFQYRWLWTEERAFTRAGTPVPHQ